MTLSKKEQIEAILEATEWKLAQRHGLEDPGQIPWDITKKDVKTYIDRYGFPIGWVSFSDNTQDGVYILNVENHWVVSYKERGAIHYESKFATRDEAMDFFLDEYYLKNKGII